MAATYILGPFRLDAETDTLFRGGEPVSLGHRAVALLRVLVEQRAPTKESQYSDAVEILRTMCDGRVLDKVRHVITHAGAVWHVDAYEGILNGIVLAEVELRHADQKLDLPSWIGEEVTGDPRYKKINMETEHIVRLRESQDAAQL